MAVEAARRQREEKIAQARRQRWLRFLLAVVVAACLAAIGIVAYDSTIFSVKRIDVTGAAELSHKEIVTGSGISLGDNIFQIDEATGVSKLLKNPWVRSASVQRRFPAIVTIKVVERTPFVGLFRPRGLYILDKTGFVLAKRAPLADTGLATIRDVDVGATIEIGRKLESPVLADVLKALLSLSPPLRQSIDTIQAPAADKLVFMTEEGIEIDYGKAEDMEAKNEVLGKVLKEESGKIIVIDVRVVTNPTTRPVVRKLGGVPAN